MRANMLSRLAVIFAFAAYFFSAVKAPMEFHIVDSVDLIFHEAGHTLFAFFPEVLTVLGGSLFQILVPLVFVLYFAFRREYFSSALLLFWLGYSTVNVSIYAADAFDKALPLLGGDGVIHDWAYLSAHLGLGIHVLLLAKILHALGLITMLLGLGGSLALLLRQWKTGNHEKVLG